MHTGSGPEAFSHTFPGASGDVVSTTATEDLGGGSYGSTSELSGTVTAVASTGTALTDASHRRSDLVAGGGLDLAAAATTGIAGGAITLDGTTERLIGPPLDVTSNALTMSGWVELSAMGTDPRVVAKTSAEGSTVYELLVDSGTNEAVARISLSSTIYEARGGTIGTGAWHNLVATWDGADLVLYVDGTQVDTTPAAGVLDTDVSVDATIGNVANADRGLTGKIDDVRVMHAAASAATIATTHANLTSPATFVTLGEQQTSAPDAWTVASAQTRSGSYALAAPETAAGTAAWAVATGIDEPGMVFESWWWTSTTPPSTPPPALAPACCPPTSTKLP